MEILIRVKNITSLVELNKMRKSKQLHPFTLKVMPKIYSLLLSLLLASEIHSQIFHINGNVSADSIPISNASITFIDEGDSSNKFTALTDVAGNYQLDIITGIREEPTAPTKFELAQNYPNPFTTSTAISYKLNQQSEVQVTIFDILGREIKKYNIGEQIVGVHGVFWDGKDNSGKRVAAGIYFYRLRVGKESLVNKMVFARGNGISHNLTLSGNLVPMNLFKTKGKEKTKLIVQTKSYTCLIDNNNNTDPKILTREIKGIQIDRDTTINIMVLKKSDSDAYFPLNIGNEWTFQLTYFDPWIGHDTTKTLDHKIITTKNVSGKIYYGFDHAMPFFPVNSFIENFDSVFIRQNEKGDIMLLFDDSEYLYFSFDPSLLGLLNRTKIKDTDYYYQLESINDSIITPIGTFNKCFKILNYFPAVSGAEYYIWFAAGYGPVKIYYPENDITYQVVKINI